MGNYHDLEPEFIERTLHLIDQYYAVLDNYPFEEQFNYTLTINCLLGLIVMPKERVITYVPTDRLTQTQTIGDRPRFHVKLPKEKQRKQTMPRRARIALAGIPWHIIQRGNNRAACFYADEDYERYLYNRGQTESPPV